MREQQQREAARRMDDATEFQQRAEAAAAVERGEERHRGARRRAQQADMRRGLDDQLSDLQSGRQQQVAPGWPSAGSWLAPQLTLSGLSADSRLTLI